jgi:hypothetical protein
MRYKGDKNILNTQMCGTSCVDFSYLAKKSVALFVLRETPEWGVSGGFVTPCALNNHDMYSMLDLLMK